MPPARIPDAARASAAADMPMAPNQSDFMGRSLPLLTSGTASASRSETDAYFVFGKLAVAILIELLQHGGRRGQFFRGNLAVPIGIERRQDGIHANEAHARPASAAFAAPACFGPRRGLRRLANLVRGEHSILVC